jgi:ATP-dependent DNA helicase RecQ
MSTAASLDNRAPNLADAEAVLRRVWDYPRFRFHQRRAVLALLKGRDCLAVLPTGGGKSLCFQIPALVLPGLTLVVSPLISLMQDQVAALRRRGVAAAYLSGTQKKPVQQAVLQALTAGSLKLLYVAPERMKGMLDRLSCLTVSLLAIDEAHCISEWGHDFRPHFRSLGRHRHSLGSPPTIAVTATATPQTCSDIITVLRLSRPVRIAQSFDRPNLFFGVRRCDNEAERVNETARLVRVHGGAAIVYVQTRDRTDGVAAALRLRGLAAAPYHAGLPAAARRALLRRFIDDRIEVMVATNAFGMGIDKPDVRLVVHLGVPARPEAYFQEAGRAGRDGLPSHCQILWSKGDIKLARRLAVTLRGPAESAAARAAKRHGLETMRRYVRTRGCRRKLLLGYLGEELKHCSGCDRCSPRAGSVRPRPTARPNDRQ